MTTKYLIQEGFIKIFYRSGENGTKFSIQRTENTGPDKVIILEIFQNDLEKFGPEYIKELATESKEY